MAGLLVLLGALLGWLVLAVGAALWAGGAHGVARLNAERAQRKKDERKR